MEAIIAFLTGPGSIVAVIFAAVAAFFGARQWGKSVGKSEARAEQAEKIQEQTAAADKVVQNADRKVDTAPSAADGLRNSGWVRKPPADR